MTLPVLSGLMNWSRMFTIVQWSSQTAKRLDFVLESCLNCSNKAIASLALDWNLSIFSRSWLKGPENEAEWNKYKTSGEQGWLSGESARLPPMCPGFDSWTRRHMRTEFVGSLLCSERFFSGWSPIQISTPSNRASLRFPAGTELSRRSAVLLSDWLPFDCSTICLFNCQAEWTISAWFFLSSFTNVRIF